MELEIPAFAAPEFLLKPPTGILHLDLVPLMTMVACVPTLHLFYKKRRIADLIMYGTGFWVAIIYHTLHVSAYPSMLDVFFLGLNGMQWRTIDIISANVLLARTLGHALGVEHPLIAMIPNVVLPFALLFVLLAFPIVGIGFCSKLTCCAMVATIAGKLLAEGRSSYKQEIADEAAAAATAEGAAAKREARRQSSGRAGDANAAADADADAAQITASISSKHKHDIGLRLPHYTRDGALRTAMCMALGLFSFAMPSMQPDRYYLWHSLWHIFTGAGYYELYLQLEGLHDTSPLAKTWHVLAGGRKPRQQEQQDQKQGASFKVSAAAEEQQQQQQHGAAASYDITASAPAAPAPVAADDEQEEVAVVARLTAVRQRSGRTPAKGAAAGEAGSSTNSSGRRGRGVSRSPSVGRKSGRSKSRGRVAPAAAAADAQAQAPVRRTTRLSAARSQAAASNAE